MNWKDRVAKITELNDSASLDNVALNTVKLSKQFHFYLGEDNDIFEGITLEGNDLIIASRQDDNAQKKLWKCLHQLKMDVTCEDYKLRVDKDKFVEKFHAECQKLRDMELASELLSRFTAKFPIKGIISDPVSRFHIRGNELIIIINDLFNDALEVVHEALLEMGITEVREVQLKVNGIPVTEKTKKDLVVDKAEFIEEISRMESLSHILHERIMQLLDKTANFGTEMKVLYFNDKTFIRLKSQTLLDEDFHFGILQKTLVTALKSAAPEIEVNFERNASPYIICSVDSDSLLKALKIDPQYVNYTEGQLIAR